MPIELGTITLKEGIELLIGSFFLGGIWVDIRAMKRTITRYGKYLTSDRDVLQKICTEHNMNHGSSIQVPNANGRTA